MRTIVIAAFLLGGPAALSAGLMLLLNLWAGTLQRRTRVTISALVAAFLIMAIPISEVFLSADSNTSKVSTLVVMVVMGVMLALVIGLPAALLMARWIEPKEVNPTIFD